MQGALFFTAGKYHHHIATNVWLGENISKASTDVPGLGYFTILFSNRDKLIDVIKRLEHQNITVKKLNDDSFEVFDEDNISIHLVIQ